MTKGVLGVKKFQQNWLYKFKKNNQIKTVHVNKKGFLNMEIAGSLYSQARSINKIN